MSFVHTVIPLTIFSSMRRGSKRPLPVWRLCIVLAAVGLLLFSSEAGADILSQETRSLTRLAGLFIVLLVIGLGGIAYFLKQTFDRKMAGLRRANEELKQSEARFRSLFMLAPLPLAEVSGDGRFMGVNDRFIQVLGYTLGDIPTLEAWRWRAYPDPEYRNSVMSDGERMLNEAAAGGVPVEGEYRVSCKDGTVRDMIVQANFIGGDNILLSFFDITRRKLAEQEEKSIRKRLHQAQRMEAIGTLAGGIAHDFNNILSSILGFSELLKDNIPENDPKSRKYNEIVISAGLRAKELVQHILTFSRSAEAIKGPVMPSLIIKEAVKLLESSLPVNIDIGIRLNDGRSVVFADATHIHQVVMNLCVNAFQAMKPKGGRLEIGLEKRTLAGEASSRCGELGPGEYLELTVSDTGCGIREEVIEHIFAPFFTTRARGEGNGMGLSVVHSIVKEMGGTIRVESEFGNGTAFHVMMPVYKSESATLPAEALQPLRKGKGRILFVDDETDIAVSAGAMLQRFGFDVTTQTRSTEALEVFLKNPEAFDLVITDYSMPGMNGVELSRKIKEKRAEIPVVLCTGFSEEITPETIDGIGAHCLLMKPLILSELANIARKAIDGIK